MDSNALEGLKENCSVFDINRDDSSNQGSSRISESDMLFEASRYLYSFEALIILVYCIVLIFFITQLEMNVLPI